MFVLPFDNDNITVNIVNPNNTIDMLFRPRAISILKTVLTKATEGIVSPIAANAEPKDKFKLD